MEPIFDIHGLFSVTLGFSKGLWLLIGAIAFALLCLLFMGAVRSGRVKARQSFVEAGLVALWYCAVFALSLITYWPKGTPLWTPSSPMPLWLGSAAVLTLVLLWIYLRRKKRFADQVSATAIRRSAADSGAGKYARALLFGGSLVLAVLAGVSSAVFPDPCFDWLVPLLLVVVFQLFVSLTGWRIWYMLGALCILAFAFLSMQQSLALDGFGNTPILAAFPVYLSVVLPMITLTFLKK